MLLSVTVHDVTQNPWGAIATAMAVHIVFLVVRAGAFLLAANEHYHAAEELIAQYVICERREDYDRAVARNLDAAAALQRARRSLFHTAGVGALYIALIAAVLFCEQLFANP